MVVRPAYLSEDPKCHNLSGTVTFILETLLNTLLALGPRLEGFKLGNVKDDLLELTS